MNSYKQFWQEHRELGIFLGSVAGALVLLTTLGMFLLLQARMNFAEEKTLQNKLQQVRTFSMKTQNYQQYVGKLQDKYFLLAEKIPEKLDLNDLVMELNAKAGMYNLQMDNLSLGGVKQGKDKIKVQQIQLSGSGQCQDVLDFMKAVETQDNLMRFSDLTLEQKDGNRIALTGNVNVFHK